MQLETPQAKSKVGETWQVEDNCVFRKSASLLAYCAKKEWAIGENTSQNYPKTADFGVLRGKKLSVTVKFGGTKA